MRCFGFGCFPPFCAGFFSSLWIYPPVIWVVAGFSIGFLSVCPDCWWWSYFCFLVFLLFLSFLVWPLCCRTAEVHSRPCLPGDHLQQLQNSKGCNQFLLLLSLSQNDAHQMSVWSVLCEATLWVYGDRGAAWGESVLYRSSSAELWAPLFIQSC